MRNFQLRPVLRVLWNFAPSFAARRRVVKLWIWSDSNSVPVAIRNFSFYLVRPVLFVQVRRHVALLRRGRDQIQA